MVERELGAADAFFARVAEDAALEAELDRRLAGPITPLITALAAWDEAPPEARDAAGRQRRQRRPPGRADRRRLAGAAAGRCRRRRRRLDARPARRPRQRRRRAWLPLARRGGRSRRRRPAAPRDRSPTASLPWRGEPQRYGTIVAARLRRRGRVPDAAGRRRRARCAARGDRPADGRGREPLPR